MRVQSTSRPDAVDSLELPILDLVSGENLRRADHQKPGPRKVPGFSVHQSPDVAVLVFVCVKGVPCPFPEISTAFTRLNSLSFNRSSKSHKDITTNKGVSDAPMRRLARFIRRNLSFRKNSKTIKSNRSVAPMLIAAVALLAAVVFSVSVESRRGGWLRKAQPSTLRASNPEVAKNSTTHAARKTRFGTANSRRFHSRQP